MKFVVLVVALLSRSRAPSSLWQLVDDLALGWWRGIRSREQGGMSASLAVGIYLAVPVVLVGLLQHFLLGVLFGFLYWLVAFAVLALCLGRRDEMAAVQRFREHWVRREWQSAYVEGAQQSLITSADSATLMHEEATGVWLAAELRALFSPLFWFVLLGPLAALSYWLLRLTVKDESPAALVAKRLLDLVDWAPARVLALTFALVGDFVGTYEQLKARLFDGQSAASVLSACAASALHWQALSGDDDELAEAGGHRFVELDSLLLRTQVTWVVILALLVLYHPFY